MSYNETAGPFGMFFSLIYLAVQFVAAYVLYTSIYLLYSDPVDINAAFGAVIIFIVFIAFWLTIQAISLILLIFTQMWKQTKPILVLSLIGLIANFAVFFVPAIISGNIDIIDLDYLKNTIAVFIIPFLLHLLPIVKGFNRLKNVY